MFFAPWKKKKKHGSVWEIIQWKWNWTTGSYYIFKMRETRAWDERGQIKLILQSKCEVSEHSRFFSLISDTEFFKNMLNDAEIYTFSLHLLEKCRKWHILMTSYLNVRRTFCPVLKSESFTPTCWPDISNVTQCPNPEIAIYLEECLFMDEFISLVKKWGKCKGQTKKVISLWWLSYIWDQFLIQLTGQK